MGLPLTSTVVKVEAEKVVVWDSDSRRRRYVFDVLIHSKFRATVWDFKCHAISNEDLDQIWQYLRYLNRVEGREETSLSGRAIDLLHGEWIEVKYNPYPPSEEPRGFRSLTQIKAKDRKTVSFEPAPDRALCSRCPYSDLCKDSAAHLRLIAT